MAVEIRLLGGFAVTIDGERTLDDAWSHRRPRDLVQLLALTPGHRLPGDRVLSTLWPDLEPTSARANLHKAAHLARRATGRPDAVSLTLGMVALFPDATVVTDLDTFDRAARAALADADAERCRAVVDTYAGELLPDQRDTIWSEPDRRRLQQLRSHLLASSGADEELLELDPLDEAAYVRLMQAALDRDDAAAALRCYGRLAKAWRTELGAAPTQQARGLREEAARLCAPPPALPPMVGRDAEVAAARRLLLQAQTGAGGCLLIEGEAGIGKTRLTLQLVADALDAGWPVLSASADSSRPVPYRPVVAALQRLVRQRPDLADPDPGTVLARLEELTSRIDEPVPLAAVRDGQLEDLVRHVSGVLLGPEPTSPALLAVDDAQDADVATLELVQRLAQQSSDWPLVVVVSGHVPSPETALGQLRTTLLRRGAQRIALRPLGADSAAALIHRSAPHAPWAQTTTDLVRLGEGNPFLLEELGRNVRPDGSAETRHDLRDVVTARLGAVSREAAASLQRVAVVHPSCNLREFAEAAGVDRSTAAEVVAECVQRGILVRGETSSRGPHGGSEEYTFRHTLVREAFADLLPTRVRRTLHSELAGRLLTSGTEPARVAHHLGLGEDPAAAVPWLLRAGEESAGAGAYGDALELTERALQYAGDRERPALLELRADCLQALGDPGAADAYSTARREAPPLSADRLLIKQAHAFLTVGDVAAAGACLGWVSAEPPAAESALHLLAHGLVAWFEGDLDGTRRYASKARAVALREARSFEASEALLLDALVAHSTGEWRLSQLPQVMRDLTVPELIAKAWDPHLCIGIHLVSAEEPFDDVAAFLRDAAETAAAGGALRGEAFARTVLGGAAVYAGRLEEATASLDAALRLQRRCGSTAGESVVLERMAALAQLRQQHTQADVLLEQAEMAARASALTTHLLTRVHATRVQGATSPEEALALVADGEEDLRDSQVCHGCSPLFLLTAAGAHLVAGQPEPAAELLRSVKDMGPRAEVGVWAASAAEIEGGLALARGKPDRAEALLSRAAEGYRQCGHLVAAERCDAALGAMRKVPGSPPS